MFIILVQQNKDSKSNNKAVIANNKRAVIAKALNACFLLLFI